MKVSELPATFRSKVVIDDAGCWLWTGAVTDVGYGSFHDPATKKRLGAHRYAYAALVGSIPDGFEIDHLCSVRRCCNPAHLEAVTHAVNMSRSPTPANLARLAGQCKRGHPRTPENLYVRPDGTGHMCIPCQRYRRQRQREQDRVEQAFRDVYGPDYAALATYQAEGR